MFLMFIGLFVPFIFMSIEATVKGMDATLAIYLVSVMNAVRYVQSDPPPSLPLTPTAAFSAAPFPPL